MNSVTFLIPIFNLDKDREENFKFVLQKILPLDIPTVVVEQVQKGKKSKIQKFLKSFPQITHKYHYSNNKDIEKSSMINLGIDIIDTEYVWLLDADAYLKFEDICNTRFVHDFIQPYNYAKRITKEESRNLKLGNPTAISFDNPRDDKVYISHPFALSGIFRKNIIEKIGKFDEKFSGWGYEDTDMAIKLYNSDLTTTILPLEALHLWHPVAEDQNVCASINLNYLFNKHGKNAFEEFVRMHVEYATGASCNIITLFRGDTDLLNNIGDFLENEYFNLPVELTWVVNSSDKKFIKRVRKRAEAFNDIRIIINEDFFPTSNYWDGRHTFVGEIYSKLFKNNSSKYIITLEDDMIPPKGGISKLIKNILRDPERIGAVGSLYRDKNHPQNANADFGNEKWASVNLDRLRNTGLQTPLKVGGGFTIWNTDHIRSSYPITVTPVLDGELVIYEGWDWYLGKTIINKGKELLIDTDLYCEHLVQK